MQPNTLIELFSPDVLVAASTAFQAFSLALLAISSCASLTRKLLNS